MSEAMFDHSSAGCLGKERYTTPQLAQKVLKRRRRDKARSGLNIYRCLLCGYYHMGNRPKRESTRRPWRCK